MKFTKEIIQKARAIYNEIIPLNCTEKAVLRQKLSEAYKASIRYFQALKSKVLRFKKLVTNELCIRNICSLQEMGYEKKTDFESKHSLFVFFDLEKKSFIRLNYYQLL